MIRGEQSSACDERKEQLGCMRAEGNDLPKGIPE